MECKICGAALPEGAERCPECGLLLKDLHQEQIQEDAFATQAQAPAEPIYDTDTSEEIATTEQIALGEETLAEELEEAQETQQEEETVEPPAPRKSTWIRVAALAMAVVLVLGIAAGVWYNINNGFLPRENDLYFRDNYTVSDSKAVSSANKVVATMGDIQLTNGLLQVFYWDQVYAFLQNYGSYISYLGLDTTKPLYEQYMPDGSITWEQFFLDSALKTWQRYQAIVLLAQAEGYPMPEDLKTHLQELPAQLDEAAKADGLADAQALLTEELGPGCTVEDYLAQLELLYYASSYVDALYAGFDPTEEEIRAHVQANAEAMMTNYGVSLDSGNIVDVRHILIQPEGCEFDDSRYVVADEDQWAACQAQAQELLEQWKASGADEAAFSTLAMAHSVDGSAAQGGLIADITPGQTVENFNNWCFDESRKAGDVEAVRTEFGYHLIYFVESRQGWLHYGKADLIQTLCSEVIENAVAENPMQINFKAIVLGQSILGQPAN